METGIPVPKRKRPILRIVLLSLLVLLLAAGVILYQNFNRLLSEALMKNFNSSIVSEVYELRFDKLRVNLISRSIHVFNVTLLPRERPKNVYPYINSSFRLKTDEILLDSVQLRTLLLENRLDVKRILIDKPNIEMMLRGERNILLPFKDSANVSVDTAKQKIKKSLFNSFSLREFQLLEAAFQVTNETKQRKFFVRNFSISLKNLLVGHQPGEYTASFKRVVLVLGHLTGDMKQGPVKHVSFKALNYEIDSLNMKFTIDTMVYRFRDFNVGLQHLDVQTADSLYHLTLKSFSSSYKSQSATLRDVRYIPNFSLEKLQKKNPFQGTGISGTLGMLAVRGLNFDSLLYARKLLIDTIALDQANISLFKNKRKALDKSRFPLYLGQTIRTIPLPVRIRQVNVTQINLKSTERKPDNTLAVVIITRGMAKVKNMTNLKSSAPLTMQADAWLMGKVRFNAQLDFQYAKPAFDFTGKLEKFDLTKLSPLISAYTPAKISTGIADEISFSGTAGERSAAGSMKFLYHDLHVDLELKNAAWANSIVAFAANTLLESSNPPKADVPPRVVNFKIERDMNKGFVNVVIKSLLNGLKETMIMSKENRQKYKKSVKKANREKQKKK